MHDRLLQPNPFSDDDGTVPPDLAAAFAKPEHLRTAAIVAALGRVLIPVLPHAHPERGADGTVSEHVAAASSEDPSTCPDDELMRVEFPGGRVALPVFSSGLALQAWNADARPVPISVAKVAKAAIQRADGVLTLDEGAPHMTWLGRSAVAALASGTDWIGPWDDPEITDRIIEGYGGPVPGLVKLAIEPGARGTAVVVLYVVTGVSRESVFNMVQTVSAVIATDKYVKARLDLVEIRPVRTT